VVDGPDAPDLVARELDREIILFISNVRLPIIILKNTRSWSPISLNVRSTSVTNYIYDTLTGQYYQQIVNDTSITTAISASKGTRSTSFPMQMWISRKSRTG
jgi:hypothetical protein